jgi:hypothetical protein
MSPGNGGRLLSMTIKYMGELPGSGTTMGGTAVKVKLSRRQSNRESQE